MAPDLPPQTAAEVSLLGEPVVGDYLLEVVLGIRGYLGVNRLGLVA
jgi:hypothetical protein